MTLLAADEPAPVMVERADSASPFVITCDHAGNLIPRSLAALGVSAIDRERHIAWDVGALGVARELAALLDGVLIAQRYSRLVIDCNRPLGSPELICVHSEATAVPGNIELGDAARRARIDAVYAPYHEAIGALLDRRVAAGQRTIYIAVHTFTAVYLGVARPWQVGVLYGSDTRLASLVLERLRAAGDLTVGDNEPYRIDHKDHGIPIHALARGLPHVLFEIRQDLLATESAQSAWGARLAEVVNAAVTAL